MTPQGDGGGWCCLAEMAETELETVKRSVCQPLRFVSHQVTGHRPQITLGSPQLDGGFCSPGGLQMAQEA
jgi:hypothetical protein